MASRTRFVVRWFSALFAVALFGAVHGAMAFTCTYSQYTGASPPVPANSWDDARNWTGCNSTTPQPGNVVIITDGNTVQMGAASYSIGSLRLDGAVAGMGPGATTLHITANGISLDGASELAMNFQNLTVNFSSAASTFAQGPFNLNNAVFNNAGGQLYLIRSASLSGNSVFNNQSVVLAGDGYSYTIGSGSAFNNSGTLRVDNALTINGAFDNSGTLQVNDGNVTLATPALYTTVGSGRIYGSDVTGGTITTNNSDLTLTSGAVERKMTFNLGTGTLFNTGASISPFTGAATNLTVNGNYSQTGGSISVWFYTPTAYDKVVVSGDVSLTNVDIGVNHYTNYWAPNGTAHSVVTAGSFKTLTQSGGNIQAPDGFSYTGAKQFEPTQRYVLTQTAAPSRCRLLAAGSWTDVTKWGDACDGSRIPNSGDDTIVNYAVTMPSVPFEVATLQMGEGGSITGNGLANTTLSIMGGYSYWAGAGDPNFTDMTLEFVGFAELAADNVALINTVMNIGVGNFVSVNNVTIDGANAAINNSGYFDMYGTQLMMLNGAKFTNLPDAAFYLVNSSTVTGLFDNQGYFETPYAEIFTLSNAAQFTQTGGTAELKLSGEMKGTGGTGTLTLANGFVTNNSGFSALNFSAVVNNGATIIPTTYDDGETFPQTIQIGGNYTQGAGGKILVTYCGSEGDWDRVDVLGAATLGGSVEVSLDCEPSAANPSNGAFFSPITFVSRSGGSTFTNVVPPSGRSLTADYASTTGVKLTFGPGPRASLSPVSPLTMSFAPQQVGVAATPKILTITNSGVAPIVFASDFGFLDVGPAAPFIIGPGTCQGSTINPGQSCTISVGFNPSAVGSFDYDLLPFLTQAELSSTVFVDDDNFEYSSYEITGEGVDLPVLISPNAHDFGSVAIGTYAQQSFTVTNNTGSAVTASSATVALFGDNAEEFEVYSNTCSSAVAIGATCTVTVRFKPNQLPVAAKSASLQVGMNSNTASASLTGTSTPAAGGYLAFDYQGALPVPGPVTVGSTIGVCYTMRNIGTSTVNISSLTATPPFTAGVSCFCPPTIAEEGSCSVGLSVTPTAAGPLTGTLTILSDALNSTLTRTVTGSGTTTVVPTVVTTINTPIMLLGQTRRATVAITNPNATPLTNVGLGSFMSAGELSVAPVPNVSSTGCGTPTFDANSGASYLNFYSATIAPGGTCSFSYDFKSVNTTGNWSIGSNSVSSNEVYSSFNGGFTTIQVLTASGPFAYVPNFGSGNLSVIDLPSNLVAATIALGTNPFGVALNSAGTRAYVTNYGGLAVSVVDTSSNSAIATVNVGNLPAGIAVTPDGSKVYVANYGPTNLGTTVSVINTTTNAVASTVTVGTGPIGVAVNRSGTRVYVANETSNTVSVINTATDTVVATIPIGAGSSPYGVTFNPTGSRAYVSNNTGNSVSVIDVATATVIGTIPVGTGPTSVAVSPDGARAYVVNSGANSVSVINTQTNTVLATPLVGAAPRGVSLNAAGTAFYVTSTTGNSVSVYDTSTNGLITQIAVDTGPFSVGTFILPSGVVNAPTITSTAPSGGVVGAAYTHTFTATGTAPYEWSVSLGSLPAGLTLNAQTGVLSGTPTAAGTSSFTVQASNGFGTAGTQPVTLAIVTPATSFTPTAFLHGAITVGLPNALSGTFTNSSAVAITLASTWVSSTDAKFVASGSGGTPCANNLVLAAGASCTFTSTFTPTSLGSFSGTYTVSFSVGATNFTQTASVTGSGAAPTTAFTPTAFLHGAITVGLPNAVSGTFTNSSAVAITLGSTWVTSADAQFVATGSGGTPCANNLALAAGASCTFTSTFTPTGLGSFSNSYSVSFNVGAAGFTQTASFSGSGATPASSFTPATYAHGAITVGVPNALSGTFTNNSGVAIALASTWVTSSNAQFVAAGSGGTPCANNLALAAGASCTFTSTFTPSGLGSFSNSYSVSFNVGAAGFTQTAGFSGSGSAPGLPTVSVTFTPANVAVGAASTLRFTLSNPNGVAAAGAALSVTLPGGLVNQSPVPQSTTTCSGGSVVGVAGGSSISLTGGTIPANGSCELRVDVVSASVATYTVTVPSSGLTTTNIGTNSNAAGATLVVSNPTIVTNTNDSGPGSLREAITYVNTACPANPIITFNIPAPPYKIQPLTPLPAFTCKDTVIDGYSQPGASPNTLTALGSTNAVVLIHLDGALQSGGQGLWYPQLASQAASGYREVRGLAITRFDVGVSAFFNVGLKGNFIGVEPDGLTAAKNGTGVVALPDSFGGHCCIKVGGPNAADTNLIAATGDAVSFGGNVSGLAERNLFGVNRNGVRVAALGSNQGVAGYLASGFLAANYTIRQNTFAHMNVAMSSQGGVFQSTQNSVVLSNAVGGYGFYPNVELTKVIFDVGADTTRLEGNLNALAANAHRLEVYSNPTPHGATQTESYIADIDLAPTAVGLMPFAQTFAGTLANPSLTMTHLGSAPTPATFQPLAYRRSFTVGAAPTTFAATAGAGVVSQTLNLTNTFGSAVTFGAIPAVATGTGYAITGGTCTGATIAPAGTCTVIVSFSSASVVSNVAGSLDISLDTLNPNVTNGSVTTTTIYRAALLANATAAPGTTITLLPAPVNFGAAIVSLAAPTQDLTITNTGANPLIVTTISFSGANAADFSLVNTTCLSGSVAAGNSCTVTVGFTSGALGARAAQLDIASNATSSPHAVTLGGSGVAAPDITYVGGTSVAPGGTLNLVFRLRNFGPQAVSAAAINVTYPAGFTNQPQGTFPQAGCGSSLGSYTDGGNNSSVSGGSLTGVTPPASAQCNLLWTQLTAPLTPGNYTFTLPAGAISFGSPFAYSNTAAVTFNVTVTSLSAPTLTFAASPISFVSGGTTVSTLTVTNPNATPLTANAFTFNYVPGLLNAASPNASSTCVGATPVATPGASNSSTSSGFTIPASGSCTFSVTLTSTTPAVYSGNINPGLIVTNGGATNSTPFSLTVTAAPTPGFSASASSLVFSSQAVSTTSASQTITITNNGGANLSWSGAFTLGGTNPADFVRSGTCTQSNPVAPSTSCTIVFAFTPGAAGARSATLTLTSNAGGSPHVISLSGSGTSVAGTPPVITTTSVPGGFEGAGYSFTFSASGTAPITWSIVSGSLPPGLTLNSTTGNISGTLTTAGNFTFTIRATNSAGQANLSTAIGVVVPIIPVISLSANSLLFGNQNVGTTSASQTIQVSNTGNGAFSIRSVDGIGDFPFTSNCSGSLAPGASCTVTVTFAPLTAGTLSGRISVNTGAQRGDGGISLSGVGVEVPTPNLVINPSSLAFTERAQGTTSPVQTIFLSNTGTADLTLRDLNITGTGFIFGPPLEADNPRNHPICGSSIPIGRSCAIGIAFSPPVNPTALGPLSGSVRFTHDATPRRVFVEAAIGLSGRATQRLEPLIRVTGSAAFGDQLLGTISAPQTISVTNTGTADLTIGGVGVVPTNPTTNPGDFLVSTGCGLLIPNASCTITVSFSPRSGPGPKSATLNIANNATNGANTSVGLSGNALALPVPIMTLSATTVSFGAVALNSAETTRAITVSNTGTANLNIGRISVTETAGFSQSSPGCGVLLPNTSCTITVGFTATNQSGAKSGTLTIPSNAASNPNTVALSAEVSGVVCSFPGLVRYQRNFIVGRCPE